MNMDNILYLLEHSPKEDAVVSIPEDLNSEFHHNPESEKLYVVIPRWKGRLRPNTTLARKIQKMGSSLIYHLPDVLSRNPDKTLDYVTRTSNSIEEDIKRLTRRYGFSDIILIGISLGVVPAIIISNRNELIKRLILIAPGHCLAEVIWEGKNTKYLRESFEQQGLCLKELKTMWKTVSPENNLDNLKGREVYVHLSRADKVVPYSSGKSLVETMKQKGINPLVKENRFLGHCLTLLIFEYFPKDL